MQLLANWDNGYLRYWRLFARYNYRISDFEAICQGKGDFTCNSFLRLQYSLVLRFPNETIETVKESLAVHVLGSRT